MKKINSAYDLPQREAQASEVCSTDNNPVRSKRRRTFNYRSSIADSLQSPEFVDKWEASRLTSLSPETLKKYRLKKVLIEDIHWVRINSKALRYNAPMLLDWLRHQGDPQAHQKTIEAYLASLPSNQSRRGRRSK